MSYDQKQIRLYVDGTLKASSMYSAALDRNPFPLLIGDGFQGIVDEVIIYDHALTLNEVESLHDQYGK